MFETYGDRNIESLATNKILYTYQFLERKFDQADLSFIIQEALTQISMFYQLEDIKLKEHRRRVSASNSALRRSSSTHFKSRGQVQWSGFFSICLRLAKCFV